MSFKKLSDRGVLRSYEEDETQDREDQSGEEQAEHDALPSPIAEILQSKGHSSSLESAQIMPPGSLFVAVR